MEGVRFTLPSGIKVIYKTSGVFGVWLGIFLLWFCCLVTRFPVRPNFIVWGDAGCVWLVGSVVNICGLGLVYRR